MLKYVNTLTSVVRPTGLPAIIFDGGLLLLLLLLIIIYLALSSIIKLINIKKIQLNILLGAASLPFLAILLLFVTNPIEMILFSLCILPSSLPLIIANAAGNELG